jgi:hypothetical protein
MRKIVDYKVVTDGMVKDLLDQGWQPLGGCSSIPAEAIYQAMVKYEQKEKIDRNFPLKLGDLIITKRGLYGVVTYTEEGINSDLVQVTEVGSDNMGFCVTTKDGKNSILENGEEELDIRSIIGNIYEIQ